MRRKARAVSGLDSSHVRVQVTGQIEYPLGSKPKWSQTLTVCVI